LKLRAAFARIHFDPKSLKFKLWTYFLLFAALLMLILWVLQVFFLNNYYQQMKINETNRIAKSITEEYGRADLKDQIRELMVRNDMYIHIESVDGTIIFSPQSEESRRPVYAYVKEMPAVKEQLMKNGTNSISVIMPENRTDTNTLAYAGYLNTESGKETVLYIFSPLYPVSSTVDILRSQLFYVMMISFLLAFLISFYLSNRISKPIKDINKQAKKLAEGKYGIIFEGGHYTEIVNLANTLTYTSLQLDKADHQQRDLMANVSHDLRTPLTMVKSYAEMIRDLSGDVPEKRDAHLQVIIDEADRLNHLVNDMLSLSKMQSSVTTLQKEDFSIKETAESIIHSFTILMEQEGYSILLDCPEELIVNGDQAKIKQVISNLLNNAIKYCGSNKTIFVSIRNLRGKMKCEITDQGMGIDPSELPYIWDRYYKTSTNHVRATTGTGLGLSIVKEILTMHNAKFGVTSEIGKGSTFWFEISVVSKGKKSGN